MPSLAAHSAVALVAAPHQMRSRRPSENGSSRSSPGGLANIGRGFGLREALATQHFEEHLGVPPRHVGVGHARRPARNRNSESRRSPARASRAKCRAAGGRRRSGRRSRHPPPCRVGSRSACRSRRCRSRSFSCARRSPRAAETARRAGGRNGGRGNRRRRRQALPPRPRDRSIAAARRRPSACRTAATESSGRTRGSRFFSWG